MQIQEILNLYENDLKLVEASLEKHLPAGVDLIPEISTYIIESGGKRLRPLLLLISSDICGYKGDRRYPLAAVLEFLHTASLLHDDVIDHADTRRGKVSANRLWGNEASVLVGDFLYSKAFKIIVEDGDSQVQNIISNATLTMVEGETEQLVVSGNIELTEEKYFSVVEKKTAILISAACAVGAVLAKCPESTVKALSEFGLKLGIAYQITDDALDYVAREEEFGKAIGTDLREGKITLPLIKALRECSPDEKEVILKTIQSEEVSGPEIRKITSLIHKYKGIDFALTKAKDCVNEAKALLDIFEDSLPKKVLLKISDNIVERKL